MTTVARFLLLWIPFTLGAALASVLALLSLWSDADYPSELRHALDRTAAALCRAPGRGILTISAACAAVPDWAPSLRAFLDTISPGHCSGALIKERELMRLASLK